MLLKNDFEQYWHHQYNLQDTTAFLLGVSLTIEQPLEWK